MNESLIGKLRLVGFIEGVSYLLLLGVAMPLKYVWEMPIYVRVTGMAHGILFILYCVLLALAMRKHSWSLGFGAYLFVATLIPFGTFYTDGTLQKFQKS
tara:strand:+ start:270 stop:566 length:297 start_codon:yes stop_codon:yes gene_type:complete